MITKGIIKSIDLLGNTCTVHIPFFETAGTDPIIETATISNTPGSYNGYKVGDVVYVGFENNSMSHPVVIGKLFLGTEKEKADPRGVSNVEESTATKKATLPADAKLTSELDTTVPNTTVPFNSLASIANELNTLNTEVGQMDRDYGNRFKQVISDIEGNKSTLEQTASRMVAKVSGSKYKTDENGNILYDENNEPISIPDATEDFGWELQKDKWIITSNNTEVLTVDSEGLKVQGEIVAEKGHLGKFIIGEEHDHINDDGTTNPNTIESGIYTDNYIDCFKKKPTGSGVYIGTDGIKLGKNFAVDPNGNMTADGLTLMGLNAQIGTKSTNYYGDTDPLDAKITPNEGDYWFDTDYHLVLVTSKIDPAANQDGTFSTKDQYIGYYINTGTGTEPKPTLIDATNLHLVQPNHSHAYKREQNCLKQWDGAQWIDIGGELVANKITANYINALNITSKKITVVDHKNSGVLFEANGLNDPLSENENYVKIAGFNVKQNTLTTGDTDTGNLIKLNSDTQRNFYTVSPLTPEEENVIPVVQQPSISFQKALNLWMPLDKEVPHIAYSIKNNTFGHMIENIAKFGVAKLTFTEDLLEKDQDGAYFSLYLNCITDKGTNTDTEDYGLTQKDYLIVSDLYTPSEGHTNGVGIPLSYVDGYALASTYGRKVPTALKVSYDTTPIHAGDYIYIVYRFASSKLGSTTSDVNYGAYVYLPTDIRMTIGDNFQVLADGTIYANSLFLGGTEKETITPDTPGTTNQTGQVSAADGVVAAVSAQLNHLEITDARNNIIFKADGRVNDTTETQLEDDKKVQIGGFTVTATSLSVGSKEDPETFVELSGVKPQWFNPTQLNKNELTDLVDNPLQGILEYNTTEPAQFDIDSNIYTVKGEPGSLSAVKVTFNQDMQFLGVVAEFSDGNPVTEQLQFEKYEYYPEGWVVSLKPEIDPLSVYTLTIPAFYQNEPVTKIAGSAFSNCTNLTQVELPNTLLSIEGLAFANCSSLLYVKLPNSITRLEDSAFAGCSGLRSIVLPTNLTTIEDWAFRDCSNLNSINLPATLTHIGEGAFSNCTSLTELRIPDQVNYISHITCSNCKNLKSITLPIIGQEPPNTSEYYDQYPFGYLFDSMPEDSSHEIEGFYIVIQDVHYGINSTQPQTTSCKYTIPNSLTTVRLTGKGHSEILKGAFSNCYSITTLILDRAITRIEEGAFEGCTGLTDLFYEGTPEDWERVVGFDLPELSLVTKYYYSNTPAPGCWYYDKNDKPQIWTESPARSTRTALEEPILAMAAEYDNPEGTPDLGENWSGDFGYYLWPDRKEAVISQYVGTSSEVIIPRTLDGCSVVAIGEEAFYGRTHVTTVTIPYTVTSIEDSAFYSCSALTEVLFEENSRLDSIGYEAFAECTKLTTIKLPYGITKIGVSAFVNCRSLITIELPDSLTTLGGGAFESCKALISIKLPKTLSELDITTFKDCTSLSKVIIPYGVTKIRTGAFAYCSNLKFISLPRSLIEVEEWAFLECSKDLIIWCEHTEGSQTWEDGWEAVERGEESQTTNARVLWGIKPFVAVILKRRDEPELEATITFGDLYNPEIMSAFLRNVTAQDELYLAVLTPAWDAVQDLKTTFTLDTNAKPGAVPRLTIGKNFTVMSDGTMETSAAKLELKDSTENTIFQVDGRDPSNPIVQLGGWSMIKDTSELERGWVMMGNEISSSDHANYVIQNAFTTNGASFQETTLYNVFLITYLSPKGLRFRFCKDPTADLTYDGNKNLNPSSKLPTVEELFGNYMISTESGNYDFDYMKISRVSEFDGSSGGGSGGGVVM